MLTMNKSRKIYILELVIIFAVAPLFLALTKGWFRPPLLLALIAAALWALFRLLTDKKFDRGELWRFSIRDQENEFFRIILLVLIASPLFMLFAWLLVPDRLFGIVKHRPSLWIAILIAYPVISVYPQELLCRAFLFRRCKQLNFNMTETIVISTLAFSFMHIMFLNWVALALTLPGGLLFSLTYRRTRSLFWVTLEHSIYGYMIFTIGLGRFFYGGTASIGSIIPH